MATIVTRSGKGSELTFVEMDANFTNLNTDKIELTNLSVTSNSAGDTSALSYNNSTGVLTFTPADASGKAVLTGSTDNQLVTVTGANAITGESTLTYDGTSLNNTTAPSFTEASTPISLTGAQPNVSGYNNYLSVNTGVSRGGYTFSSNASYYGSKVDRHILFFDLDDEFGERPTGQYQGDRNLWIQANHSGDKLDIFFDGFNNNEISSWDGNDASYARTPIVLHGSTTSLKSAGSEYLQVNSSGTDIKNGRLDLGGENITMGGGNIDMENGGILNSSGALNFDAIVQVEVTSSATDTLIVNNKAADGLGLRVNLGDADTTAHTSGDAIMTRRATDTGAGSNDWVETFKVSTTSGSQSEVSMEQLGHLTNQTVVGTGTKTDQGWLQVEINGATRYIPYYS